MTQTFKLPCALLTALLLTFAFAASSQAASPKLAVSGDYSEHEGATGVASLSLQFYSKNTFKVKNWKQLKGLANKYRPKGVVLHLQGQKIKVKQIAEVMPEFIFPFYAPAEVPGLEFGPDYPAKVTFKNKVKKGTQTLKFTLKYYVPEPDPVEDEVDCDLEPEACE